MILLALLIPIIYWIYLWATTSMVVIHDGYNFLEIATIIYNGGWSAYFKTGPHNEPIYPALIVLAMHCSKYFAMSYERILAAFQLLILLLSQILTLRLLGVLNIRKSWKAIIIFYMGISPALVNAALSHWSEITGLPFVLSIILISCYAWQRRNTASLFEMATIGMGLGCAGMGIISVKAVFELAFVVYLLAFVFIAIQCWQAKNTKGMRNMLFCFAMALGLFEMFIFSYKNINQHFNGHFMISDRGPYILYGNVVKRTNPLTPRSFAASIAFIPGDGICRSLFEEKECAYWTLQNVDYFGQGKLRELRKQGVAENMLDKTLLTLSKDAILNHPVQYGVLTVLEGFKIFFWESTHVGFVRYPTWLTQIFDNNIIKNPLRLIIALLSFMALVFALFYVAKNRKNLGATREETPAVAPLLFIFCIWLPFTAFYSLFFIHTRYCFLMAPLYLTLIAFFLQTKFSSKK